MSWKVFDLIGGSLYPCLRVLTNLKLSNVSFNRSQVIAPKVSSSLCWRVSCLDKTSFPNGTNIDFLPYAKQCHDKCYGKCVLAYSSWISLRNNAPYLGSTEESKIAENNAKIRGFDHYLLFPRLARKRFHSTEKVKMETNPYVKSNGDYVVENRYIFIQSHVLSMLSPRHFSWCIIYLF